MTMLPVHLADVVDITHWELDEDNPFGPQGAKPKRFVISPNPTARPDIVSGHRYVFKEPSGNRRMQIWSEVIAYRLAHALGLPVPPAFLATDAVGSPGVLVEFFFGRPGHAPQRFVHAIERFQGRGVTTDFRRGSMRDNIALTRGHQVVNWRSWWAEAIAFDAIIGNTDRHSENWGFLVQRGDEQPVHTLAPIFDNGTSLGFSIRDEDMPRLTTGTAFDRFVRRGAHHCGWLAGNDETALHPELCRRFMETHGGDGTAMDRVIQLRDSTIDDVVQWCVTVDFPVRFSEQRADFVSRLVKAKRDAVIAAIGAKNVAVD
jgi:hypothetical protein